MFDIFEAEQLLVAIFPRLSIVCHLRWHITRHVNHKPFGGVCNRAAVVDGGVFACPHIVA